MQVKAKCIHFHSGALREAGDVFEYTGPLYEHIEAVKQPKGKPSADTDDTTAQGASD